MWLLLAPRLLPEDGGLLLRRLDWLVVELVLVRARAAKPARTYENVEADDFLPLLLLCCDAPTPLSRTEAAVAAELLPPLLWCDDDDGGRPFGLTLSPAPVNAKEVGRSRLQAWACRRMSRSEHCAEQYRAAPPVQCWH